MRASITLACILIALVVPCVHASKIKHVVVVMLENNSFDRLFGFFPGVDGLTGKEWNPTGVGSSSGREYINTTPSYVPGCDPAHSVPATTMKIFGDPVVKSNASMSGFVLYEELFQNNTAKNRYCDVMSAFVPEKLPVISFLAREYSIFDRYFSSMAGPTWPNRFLTLMGTTAGCTDTEAWFQGVQGRLFPGRTIFDQVNDAGLSWRNYFQTTPWELIVAGVMHNPQNLRNFNEFLRDCKEGTLPSYSWINPRSGVDGHTGFGSNDQHPDHDMALGEAFLKEIYEAVRASPQWNETALIITYDEHGGFYDHVPPPMHGVPAPDDIPPSPYNYSFTRLGIRVPLLVISPYVPRNTIVHDAPASQKPFPTSQYDHTSILATARELLGIKGNLTRRDAWAARFSHVFSLDKPRTDCPMKAPEPPAPARNAAVEEADLPLNDLQETMLSHHKGVSRLPTAPLRPLKQGDLHRHLMRHYQHAMSRLAQADSQYQIVVQADPVAPVGGIAFVEDQFNFDSDAHRIRTVNLAFHNIPYCLTASLDRRHVLVQVCRNSSKEQEFLYESDGSFRHLPSGLCVTAVRRSEYDSMIYGVYDLELRKCERTVFQGFGHYGRNAPGSGGDYPLVVLGDGQGMFTIIKKTS